MVPWDGLLCVFVLFPDHTHLLLKHFALKCKCFCSNETTLKYNVFEL